MGSGGSDDQGEPGREDWDDVVKKTEAYETEEDELVMYDGSNPLAWIKSTLFGTPIDILEPTDDGAPDEEQGGP